MKAGAGSIPTKRGETLLLQPSRAATGGSERRTAERWGNEECWDDGNVKFICHFLKIYFFNVTKGGSEKKKEVAGAEEKHNSPGEVLAEGQRVPPSPAGHGNQGCSSWGMEELGFPSGLTPSHPTAPGIPGEGRSKTWLRCCWGMVWAATAAESLGQLWDKQRLVFAFLWQMPLGCSAHNHTAPMVLVSLSEYFHPKQRMHWCMPPWAQIGAVLCRNSLQGWGKKNRTESKYEAFRGEFCVFPTLESRVFSHWIFAGMCSRPCLLF